MQVKKRGSKRSPVPQPESTTSPVPQPESSTSPAPQPESSTSPVPQPDSSTSPPPQPDVRTSVEDDTFRDSTTPETPKETEATREARLTKHVSFSDDVGLEGGEDKSVSPVRAAS